VEAHGELLPDLTVVVGHDVARAGVETHELGDLDGDAGFLDGLADGGVQNGFTKIDGAARKRPAVIVDLVDEQKAPLVVTRRDGHRRDEAVGLGSVRIVVVVHPCHAHSMADRATDVSVRARPASTPRRTKS
jgi:hypothetical protein